ncbi:MAG: feruloyl-CoA synthase, partial [Gammaproteobacteria bacterium]|nr:feruloyl-CoA synthase [Gammaproteobacteria bacterium]
PTLADYLDAWAEQTPLNTWMARRDAAGQWCKINYHDAQKQAQIIGASLLKLGLGPEKPLIILSENSLEHALLGIACAYVGIPYAPVSPAYSLVSKDFAKLKSIVSTLEPGAVFADDGAKFDAACQAIASEKTLIINHRNLMKYSIEFDSLRLGDVQFAMQARQNISAQTVVKYLFTSGSTGSPKAVINTNKMICSMQAMVRDCFRFVVRQPPIVLDWAPWHHTAAGNKVSYMAMTNGGSYYIDDGRPVAGKFDETINNLRELSCTWYFNVPIGWDMLVEALEQDAELANTFFLKLGMMFYAGAGMAQHTWTRLRQVAIDTVGYEVLLATGLGSTETAPFALACTEVQESAGNVGVPSRGLTLKLVPNDDKYELRLKGPSITPGYFKEAEKTADAFDEEGFYKMGDALRPADPDDFSKGFFFAGRVAENFKLSTGTWVSVGAVRATLVDALEGLVKDAVIVGENQSELGAFLILADQSLEKDSYTLHHELSVKLTQAAKVATGSASRVRRAMVLHKTPSFDLGEVTDKGSLNQIALRSNNADLIARLYSDDNDPSEAYSVIKV